MVHAHLYTAVHVAQQSVLLCSIEMTGTGREAVFIFMFDDTSACYLHVRVGAAKYDAGAYIVKGYTNKLHDGSKTTPGTVYSCNATAAFRVKSKKRGDMHCALLLQR